MEIQNLVQHLANRINFNAGMNVAANNFNIWIKERHFLVRSISFIQLMFCLISIRNMFLNAGLSMVNS